MKDSASVYSYYRCNNLGMKINLVNTARKERFCYVMEHDLHKEDIEDSSLIHVFLKTGNRFPYVPHVNIIDGGLDKLSVSF